MENYSKIVELVMKKSLEVFQEEHKEPKDFINTLFESSEFQMIFEDLTKNKTEKQKEDFFKYLEICKKSMILMLEKQYK